jgi:hypothetical protein
MNPLLTLRRRLKISTAKAFLVMTIMFAAVAAALVLSLAAGALTLLTFSIYFLILVTTAYFAIKRAPMRWLRATLSWIFLICFGLIMIFTFDSILNLSGKTPPPKCMRTLLSEGAGKCHARFSEGQKGDSQVVATEASTPEPNSSVQTAKSAQPLIYLQFVPPQDNETLVKVGSGLVDLGWWIQGGAKAASKMNHGPQNLQVRYFNAAYASTAMEIAKDLSALKGGVDVTVNDLSTAGLLTRPNLLEIWLAE